jgi:hypothetical protein
VKPLARAASRLCYEARQHPTNIAAAKFCTISSPHLESEVESKQTVLFLSTPNTMQSGVVSSPNLDLFEDVGKKVENLSHDHNGVATPGSTDGGNGTDGDDQRMVDEIESLCMNCQEEVGFNSLFPLIQ